jgi:hypothetical protein
MLFAGHPSIRRVGYCRERDVAPIQYSRAKGQELPLWKAGGRDLRRLAALSRPVNHSFQGHRGDEFWPIAGRSAAVERGLRSFRERGGCIGPRRTCRKSSILFNRRNERGKHVE